MSGITITKLTLEQQIRGLIAGTQKHMPTGSLTVGGATYTGATIVQALQGLADSLASVDAAKASWKEALKNETDARAKVGPVVQDYRSWLVASLGNAPSTLADYGLSPPKARTPLTAEEKVAQAQKAKATRAARHTMGSVQKKAVKGTVPAAAPVIPSTASPPVAPSPVASAPAQATSVVAAPHSP